MSDNDAVMKAVIEYGRLCGLAASGEPSLRQYRGDVGGARAAVERALLVRVAETRAVMFDSFETVYASVLCGREKCGIGATCTFHFNKRHAESDLARLRGQGKCRGCAHEARRHYPIGGCAEQVGRSRCGCDWKGSDD